MDQKQLKKRVRTYQTTFFRQVAFISIGFGLHQTAHANPARAMAIREMLQQLMVNEISNVSAESRARANNAALPRVIGRLAESIDFESTMDDYFWDGRDSELKTIRLFALPPDTKTWTGFDYNPVVKFGRAASVIVVDSQEPGLFETQLAIDFFPPDAIAPTPIEYRHNAGIVTSWLQPTRSSQHSDSGSATIDVVRDASSSYFFAKYQTWLYASKSSNQPSVFAGQIDGSFLIDDQGIRLRDRLPIHLAKPRIIPWDGGPAPILQTNVNSSEILSVPSLGVAAGSSLGAVRIESYTGLVLWDPPESVSRRDLPVDIDALSIEEYGGIHLGNSDLIVRNIDNSLLLADAVSLVVNGNITSDTTINGLPTAIAVSYANQVLDHAFDELPAALHFTVTIHGDANLDGVVSALDYERIDLNVGISGESWYGGDLNYDGVVDALDYERVDLNIGNGVFPGGRPAGVFIPEPASLSLVAMAASLMGRRRRA